MSRIVVVEDYDDARELLTFVLQHAGHEVFGAADGEQGVRLTRAHQPHAIFMDLAMPVLDGLGATRLIKADRATSHIPVIAYTARAFSAERAPELFAAVCQKPATPEQILRVLQAVTVRRPR